MTKTTSNVPSFAQRADARQDILRGFAQASGKTAEQARVESKAGGFSSLVKEVGNKSEVMDQQRPEHEIGRLLEGLSVDGEILGAADVETVPATDGTGDSESSDVAVVDLSRLDVYRTIKEGASVPSGSAKPNGVHQQDSPEPHAHNGRTSADRQLLSRHTRQAPIVGEPTATREITLGPSGDRSHPLQSMTFFAQAAARVDSADRPRSGATGFEVLNSGNAPAPGSDRVRTSIGVSTMSPSHSQGETGRTHAISVTVSRRVRTHMSVPGPGSATLKADVMAPTPTLLQNPERAADHAMRGPDAADGSLPQALRRSEKGIDSDGGARLVSVHRVMADPATVAKMLVAAVPSNAGAMPDDLGHASVRASTSAKGGTLSDGSRAIRVAMAPGLDALASLSKPEAHHLAAGSASVLQATIANQIASRLATTPNLPHLTTELRAIPHASSMLPARAQIKVLSLQLQPKDLGTIDVRMALRGGKIEVSLQATLQTTTELLMQDHKIILEALRRENFDIDKITIQRIEPDRENSGAATMGFAHGGKSGGQSDDFQSASREQASRHMAEPGEQSERSQTDQRNEHEHSVPTNAATRRRDLYI